MIETIGVLAIVAVVLTLAGRSIYLTFTSKKKGQCCGCGPFIRTDVAPCLSQAARLEDGKEMNPQAYAVGQGDTQFFSCRGNN